MPVRIRRGPPGKRAIGLRLRITLVFMAIMGLSILMLSYTFGRLL